MTTWGVGVGDGDSDGEGLGDTRAMDGRGCVSAWTAPQAVKANARRGATTRMPETRMVARGFYERRPSESIPGVLTFPGH